MFNKTRLALKWIETEKQDYCPDAKPKKSIPFQTCGLLKRLKKLEKMYKNDCNCKLSTKYACTVDTVKI